MVSAAAGAGSSAATLQLESGGHTFAVITVEMQQHFVPCKRGRFDSGLGLGQL